VPYLFTEHCWLIPCVESVSINTAYHLYTTLFYTPYDLSEIWVMCFCNVKLTQTLILYASTKWFVCLPLLIFSYRLTAPKWYFSDLKQTRLSGSFEISDINLSDWFLDLDWSLNNYLFDFGIPCWHYISWIYQLYYGIIFFVSIFDTFLNPDVFTDQISFVCLSVWFEMSVNVHALRHFKYPVVCKILLLIFMVRWI